MQTAFIDLAIIIVAAAVLAYISKIARQPLIPAYIVAGILLGPVFRIIGDTSITSALSELGIAFLLFIVGMELNLKSLKGVGLISVLGGTLQVFLTFIAGFVIAIAIGFSSIPAAYIGIILAFSSTMIVVKLLSDRNEISTLHGKIIIGILLVQDLIAIIVLVLLSSAAFSGTALFEALLKGFGALIIALLLGEFIFPHLFKQAASNQELLFTLSLAVCFAFAGAFYMIGLSIAIGAFIAGLVLASLPYSFEMSARIKPLKNFFAIIFFVSLGTLLTLEGIKLLPLILFTLIVILIKPLIIFIEAISFGFHRRTSFLAAISLAQVSEFGFIVAAQGLLIGHISNEIFSYTIIIATLSIAITAYILKYDDLLYQFFEKNKLLSLINSNGKQVFQGFLPEGLKHEVIICGYDRIGHKLGKDMVSQKKRILVVDYNPDIIKRLSNEKIPCIYGDISDPEILPMLQLDKAKIIVSTIPEIECNKHILKIAKHHNHACTVILTAEQVEDALQLYNTGADYVILPHFLGAAHASLILKDVTKDIKSIVKTKITHIKELEERKQLGHEHPMNLYGKGSRGM